jgi:integrase
MELNLNVREIVKLMAPETGQYDVYDSGCAGLVLRIGKLRKTWFIRHRRENGKRQVVKLGPCEDKPDIRSIRSKARKLMDEIDAGQDLAAQRRRQRETQTFAKLVETFLARHQCRESSRDQYRKILKRNVLPVWHFRQPAKIKRHDVTELIDKIRDRAPIESNRALATISTVFSFALRRGLVESNPCMRVQKIREEARERQLSDDEIRTLWTILDRFPPKISEAYKLMLILGQRVNEILGMAWAEVDLERALWTLPAERSKSHREHVLPLPPMAVEILRRRKAEATTGDDYVFPSRKGINRPLGFMRKRHDEVKEACGFDFQCRDLRRTAATRIALAGSGRFIVQQVLGHADASVTARYDRYTYVNEMRSALIKWDHTLEEILSGTPSNVIELSA